MRTPVPWPLASRPRVCRECYRPIHDGECERPFAFPGWKSTDCPTWPPRRPVTVLHLPETDPAT